MWDGASQELVHEGAIHTLAQVVQEFRLIVGGQLDGVWVQKNDNIMLLGQKGKGNGSGKKRAMGS